MPRIFISYRRDDSQAHSARICDSLVRWFGARNVFMDVDDILPGTRFPEVIQRALETADLVLVVIGKKWLTVQNEDGRRRLDEPRDFVRLEVMAALKREVPVLPILVQGARMPSRSELPEPMQALADREALDLSDSRWSYDTGRLRNAIRHLSPSSTFLRCQAVAAYIRGRPFRTVVLPVALCSAIFLLWQSGAFRADNPADDLSSPTPRHSSTQAIPALESHLEPQSTNSLVPSQILFSRQTPLHAANTNSIRAVKLLTETERTLVLEIAFTYPGASGVGSIMIYAEALDDEGEPRASGRTGSIGVGAAVEKLLVKPSGRLPLTTSRLRVGFWQRTGPNSLEELEGGEIFPFRKTWQ